jgi:hypothetical protein
MMKIHASSVGAVCGNESSPNKNCTAKTSTPTKKKNHRLRLLQALVVTHPILGCRGLTGPSELETAWQQLPCISLVENQHWTSTGYMD